MHHSTILYIDLDPHCSRHSCSVLKLRNIASSSPVNSTISSAYNNAAILCPLHSTPTLASFKESTKELMYSENSKGDKMHPYCKPVVTSKESLYSSPTFTSQLIPKYTAPPSFHPSPNPISTPSLRSVRCENGHTNGLDVHSELYSTYVSVHTVFFNAPPPCLSSPLPFPRREQLQSVAFSYVVGLQWILKYYYSGVPSWSW